MSGGIDNKEFEDRFLNDVKDHQMIVIRDIGVDRHIKFKAPGTSIYWFDLITWSGHLCVTGDCGTFVFRRIEDMFGFFRMDPKYMVHNPDRKLFINTGYWHEKCLAEERHGGCKKYSEDLFRKEVKRWFADWAEDQPEELAAEVWSEVEEDVLSFGENGYSAMDAALTFVHDDFNFDDFWEIDLEEYTFDYIWCLYAIVWGISIYDKNSFKPESEE